MLWHLYLQKGTVYVPTVAKTEAGYYLDIDPVDVISATDLKTLCSAINRTIRIGNPKIATPTRAAFPKPVVLNYAKVKSWSAFEKDADCWEIYEKEGVYRIQKLPKGQPHCLENDWKEVESLPSDVGIDSVAQRIATLVQSAFDRS